jgi:signal transduction histidine kinase
MKVAYKNDLPSEGLNIETLMEALFYRDEFMSIASHELKTPLTSIKLQAQVFKRQTRIDSGAYAKDKVDRMVEQIDAQASRLMKLVNDMLDISRIRSGQLRMTKENFNLSEAITETAFKYNQSSIELAIEGDITFFGDQERIAGVLSKLLDNALKYGKSLPIQVKLLKKKNKITLSVKDHGEGISEEDQKRIFHRFQRAVAASEVSGLGLGLYIAREITEAHGGKISVKSELGAGSTFSVEFKAAGPA